MKRYPVAAARQHLAEVLDRAEEGEDVVIERRGVRFSVKRLHPATERRAAPRIEILDPDVEAGTWSWSWSPTAGAKLTSSRSRSRSRGRPRAAQ